MHIVALVGRFYPNISASSSCVKPYLVELAKENDVEVICSASDIYYLESIKVDGLKLHFATTKIDRLFLSYSSPSKGGIYSIFSAFLSFCSRLSLYLKENIFPSIYDSSLEKSYFKSLSEIECKKHIDVIISVTFPFYTHVYALKFKQNHSNVKWISYTTDPFAYNEANPVVWWKKSRAKEIEKQVYNHCDYCIVTEELRDNLLKDYQIPSNKIFVLPYLIDTGDKIVSCKNMSNERPQVIYAGYLFHRVRDPKILLQAFTMIQGCDLNLYVAGDRKCRKELRKVTSTNVRISGLVHRDKYLCLLKQADILVNLSNNTKFQAPHKLYELIATGRPIINFYYYRDSGFDIIEKYPLGINVSYSEDITVIANSIEEFIYKHRNMILPVCEINDIFKDNLLLNQITKLKQLFRN